MYLVVNSSTLNVLQHITLPQNSPVADQTSCGV